MRFDSLEVVVNEGGRTTSKEDLRPILGILPPLTGVRLTDRGNGDSFF